MIGSANLTFGLAGKYEIGVVVGGIPARNAWALGDQLWNHAEAVPWSPKGPARPDELDPRLYQLLAQYIYAGLTIPTLGPKPEPNTILAFGRTGATVATKKSPRWPTGRGTDDPDRVRRARHCAHWATY